MGDSLSAAQGIAPEHGWVQLLAEKLSERQSVYSVANASVSGETTAGGLARLPDALARYSPRLVIIELGANDGLRGYPIDQMERNLSSMISLSREAGAKVLLVRMHIPPNYGPGYTQTFSEVFEKVALAEQVSLSPFLLENVAGQPGLIQQDGLHPTASAQPVLLANIWPALQAALAQ